MTTLALATSTTSATAAPKPGSNAPTFESRIKLAKEFGEKEGDGGNSQALFVMMCIEGAFLGTLSTTKKHTGGRSDADLLCEAYVLARGKSARFDRKSGSGRKFISTTNKCIRFGSTPKWGRGQPLQTAQEFEMHWQEMRKKGMKRLDDFNNAMMRFMTAQLANDRLLTDEVRNSYAFKPAPADKDTADRITAIRKATNKLGITHKGVNVILAACTEMLADLAKAGK